jgi:hypothetical protein
VNFDDLAEYSQQMAGRKTKGDPKQQGLSPLTHIGAALSGLGEGIMDDNMYKRYSRGGGGYQNLAATGGTNDRLLDRERLYGQPNQPETLMSQTRASALRARTNQNRGGMLK